MYYRRYSWHRACEIWCRTETTNIKNVLSVKFWCSEFWLLCSYHWYNLWSIYSLVNL